MAEYTLFYFYFLAPLRVESSSASVYLLIYREAKKKVDFFCCTASCARESRRKLVELDFAGYKFDEHDRDSVCLRLQFARYPGARSGGTHRGKR